jgi:hypothetical protein
VDAELKPGSVTETVNVTAEAEKTIDLTSVTQSHNVTAEELDRMPKGRSFQGIALAAPGVNAGEIEGGFQVNGASGAENSYTVDGVATNSLIYGSSRQNTVFEYLQEVQVKTGGIDAEYGGARRSHQRGYQVGRQPLHRRRSLLLQRQPLSAGPVNRLVLDPNDLKTVAFYQDDETSNHQSEFGGSIGGPIKKDHLFFFGSISPRVIRQTRPYNFSNGTQPGSVDQEQTLWQGFGKVTCAGGRVHANANPHDADAVDGYWSGMTGSGGILSSHHRQQMLPMPREVSRPTRTTWAETWMCGWAATTT